MEFFFMVQAMVFLFFLFLCSLQVSWFCDCNHTNIDVRLCHARMHIQGIFLLGSFCFFVCTDLNFDWFCFTKSKLFQCLFLWCRYLCGYNTTTKCVLIHYGFHQILNEFGHFYLVKLFKPLVNRDQLFRTMNCFSSTQRNKVTLK